MDLRDDTVDLVTEMTEVAQEGAALASDLLMEGAVAVASSRRRLATIIAVAIGLAVIAALLGWKRRSEGDETARPVEPAEQRDAA